MSIGEGLAANFVIHIQQGYGVPFLRKSSERTLCFWEGGHSVPLLKKAMQCTESCKNAVMALGRQGWISLWHCRV